MTTDLVPQERGDSPQPLERGTLLGYIDFELDSARRQSERPGWSPWAFAAAIGAVVWALVEEAEAGRPAYPTSRTPGSAWPGHRTRLARLLLTRSEWCPLTRSGAIRRRLGTEHPIVWMQDGSPSGPLPAQAPGR